MARFQIKGGNVFRTVGGALATLAARVAAGGLSAAQRPRFDPDAGFDEPIKDDGDSVALAKEIVVGVEDTLDFDASIGPAKEQADRAIAAAKAAGVEDLTYVQFHFDRSLKVSEKAGVRIVNVVVPDLSSKLLRGEDGEVILDDHKEPALDLNSVAEECFGNIVFATCQG